jgi:hypothetical protein
MNKNGGHTVSIYTMKMGCQSTRSLAKGQVWKTRAADIEILALGRRLIHYKITKQLGQKEVSAQISGIEAMENYLKSNAARLAVADSAN